MERSGRRAAAFLGLGVLVVVGVGHMVGRALWATDCSVVTAFASLAGVILALVAVIREPRPGDVHAIERVAGIGLLAYVVLATATAQFAWVPDARAIAFALSWLFPIAVGAIVLPTRGYWLSGLGFWSVLLAGTTALSYSATHTGSGVGLVFAWLG